MGAHTGRCFRARRRTARRKERQDEAFAALRAHVPMSAVFLAHGPKASVGHLSSLGKQNLVQGFTDRKRDGFRQPVQRIARRGARGA